MQLPRERLDSVLCVPIAFRRPTTLAAAPDDADPLNQLVGVLLAVNRQTSSAATGAFVESDLRVRIVRLLSYARPL